jgi:hypothetical protein
MWTYDTFLLRSQMFFSSFRKSCFAKQTALVDMRDSSHYYYYFLTAADDLFDSVDLQFDI